MKRCQICPKQAFFSCSRCQNALYCSKSHQIQHWKSKHSKECIESTSKSHQNLQILQKKKFLTRKQFYENYSNKIFQICILDAKAMIEFQKNIKNITKNVMDQLEYGASVCVLVRSYILINNKKTARQTLSNYLFQKKQFLETYQVPNLNSFTDAQKQLFQKKMNLISTIANLSYSLEMDCVKYYVIYTKNIEHLFGEDSLEASNCYFLLGTYFAEEGFFKKAIACFQKARNNRGNMAGDCYFNVGVLLYLQKQYVKALQMFEQAYKFRNEQYGDSSQLAEVLENIGQIYVELNDFITAMMYYQKSYKIRCPNPKSAQQNNLKDLIQELYDKLCVFMHTSQDLKKPSIFLHLKSKIQQEYLSWIMKEENKISKKDSLGGNQNENKQGNKKTNEKKDEQNNSSSLKKDLNSQINQLDSDSKNQNFVIISQQLLDSLGQNQLYLLSELQLELMSCNSTYSSIYTFGKSLFLEKLSPKNFQILKRDNLRLFQLIRLENIDNK